MDLWDYSFVSLPFLKPYKYLNHTKKDFPNAYQNQNEILSLPIDPSINKNQILYVVKQVNNFRI